MWPTPVGLCFDGDSSHAHPLKFEEITAKFENSTYLDELYGLLRFSNLTSWPCLICSARIPFRYCSIASHMSHVGKCIPSKPMFLGWYGGWKKSCTSWYMVYPLIIPLFTMCHSYLPVTNWCRISSIHSMCDIINIYILLYIIYIWYIEDIEGEGLLTIREVLGNFSQVQTESPKYCMFLGGESSYGWKNHLIWK